MSVINKMLKDLDRRQALGAAVESSEVRPQVAKPGGREWFWRLLVVLLTAALAWMGWVAVQLLPRKPIATEFAFQAAAEAQSRATAAKTAPPPPVVAPAVPAAVAAVPAPETKSGGAPASDTLRLATELEKTPVREVPAEPVKPEPVKAEPAKAAKAEPARPAASKPKPAAQPSAKASVDKRDRVRSTADNAEAHFRRAALLLSHGRVSEAEDQLIAALQADPSHNAARQAYVALLLEQRRVEPARRLLQDALAVNPSQAPFAYALARVHVEQRDYQAALEVMDRAGATANTAEFQSLRGAVLQRLGRHAEAVEAYENAIRGGTPPAATTWIGFGISLEALGRRAEAAQAYRRALTAGPVAAEAREYAEARARALE